MTEFKFFDKKQNKFVSPFKGPKNIWEARHSLGIWNTSVHNDSLKKMVSMNKKNNKTFELYLKHNNKYVIATNNIINEILSSKNTTIAKSLLKKSKKAKSKKQKKVNKTSYFNIF